MASNHGVACSLLGEARAAAQRGDWARAYSLFTEADASAGLDVPDLERLATSAYPAGHLDAAIDAWERAHALSLQHGDPLKAAAAAVRVALCLLIDTALLAPIRGWAERAERLLQGHDITATHAWLAVVKSYERLLSGDFDRAHEWARRAIEVGTDRDAAAAALARVAEARALILQGDVRVGLQQLNEAAVAGVSGEIDPMSTGIVYCEVVCAMQAIAQYDLAEQWTEAMERWRKGLAVGSIHGRCRVHRAEILRLRGAYAQAEQEALRACEELRPYLQREFGWPLTELGRIRFRRGDVPGAEAAFVAAHEAGWDPQPGLALVRLAQGDGALAVALIRDSLERPLDVPSKELPPNTDLRRAPLLEAQVEIELAAGDIERARCAADELSRIASTFDSTALGASALLARGRTRLAVGDSARAVESFEAAAQRWRQIGAPYETAVARAWLGCALRLSGNDVRGTMETDAARAMFERLELPMPSMTIRPRQDALPVPSGPALDATCVDDVREHRFLREGEYWSIVFDGRTVRLRDAKGLRYLARLLACPGREFHVVDLVMDERSGLPGARRRLEQTAAPGILGDAGTMLDARARDAYRRRLEEIDADIEDARRLGHTERVERAIADRHFIARELSRAVGLGGRARRLGSAAERARASVTLAIRHAMRRIQAQHAPLGRHLEATIRTGTYCVYVPDPRIPIEWVE